MDKLVKQNKPVTLNSREVAKMVNIRHDNLIRNIDVYIRQMEEANKIISKTTSELRASDYFIESTYLGGNGEQRPCYKITKMGCDFIAHKMNGVKGTAFTATYIKRFYELEESQYKLPLSYPEALRQLADKAEQSEKLKTENKHKQNVIDGFTKDIPLANKRQLINQVLRYKGANFHERWKVLYKQFEMKYHIESLDKKLQKYNQSHKPKLKNKIDYVEKVLNMIPELYEIACVLYESDIEELQQKMFSLCENKNLISV